MRIGLHLPNGTFAADDWARIAALGVSDYVDLDLFAGRWASIKAAQPHARIHARVYVRGDLGNARDEAVVLADLVRQHGQHVATWRWRNEPNLESPGADWYHWRQFLIAFGRYALELAPGVRLYTPAVAPWAPEWLLWMDATKWAYRPGNYAGMDCHVYGDPADVRDLLSVARNNYDGPLLCTEYNPDVNRTWTPEQWAADLPGVLAAAREYRADAVCPFIWYWHNPDQPNGARLSIKGTPVEAALARVAKGVDTMGLREQFPGEYAAWEKAGGVEHNFKAHLIGTKRIKPTADDLRTLVGNARASLIQVDAALDVLLPKG